MKKYLLSIIAAFILVIGCAEKKKPLTTKEQLKIAMDSAYISESIEKEIFLGFKFGMAEEEVKEYLSILLKQEKIYLYRKDNFQYDLHTQIGIIPLELQPEFHNGELYKMIFKIKNTSLEKGAISKAIKGAFESSEKSKQYKCFFFEEPLDKNGAYIYINKNILIAIHSSGMEYANAPILKQIGDAMIDQHKDKVKQSTNDF